MKTWINKKTAGGIFLAAVLLLIFFSKTIYTYNLPGVTAVKPVNGQLSKIEVGSGTVQWAEVDSIYIPADGVVGDVYVAEGETVKAGQKLCAMIYDKEDNEWKLQEIENNISRLKTEIENLNIRLAAAEKQDAELLQTRQSLQAAEKHLAASGELYGIGSISAVALQEAGDRVDYLRLKLDNQKQEAAENLELLRLDLTAKELELENQTIMAAPYRKTQAIHSEQTILTAPGDGVLVSFHVAKGEKVQKDTLAIKVGTGNDYVLECRVSLDNNFIVPGDTCSLSNSSHQLKGTVSSVVPEDREKIVKIRFLADGVMAGETFSVMFQKESATTYILVPNGAVNQDQNGYFLKQLKRRNGIMGKEYYLERVDVYIGDSDSKNTAIIRGVTFFEPVQLSGSKETKTGDVVWLKNAGDFFEE